MYHPEDERYKHLAGQEAIVPIFGHKVPILADETVEKEKGTGLVMVCTFGDKHDIEWFKKFNLPYKQSIGFDGKWIDQTGPLAGLKVHDARKKILELLQETESLISQKDITHNVNIHERCKKEIEYVVLKQWFVKIVENKDKFLQAANQINWYPKHMQARYKDWVENLSWDWCISRQRVFGIPFPVWYCNDCDAIIVADKENLPIDPQETPATCHTCGSQNTRPEKDVMDTWNTSSLTPYICKKLHNQDKTSPFSNDDFIPMSMRPQAHDIIRTWAFYTIIKSWMHQEKLPWSNIVISGFVLSSDRDKISKSHGNAPTEPTILLQKFAPDAIRFWTASGSLGQDIAFSEDQMKIGQKLMTKLWNAFKFIKMHLDNDNYAHTPPKSLNTINQWMIDETNIMLQSYKKHLNAHEFGAALQTIERLYWAEFCDNYIEIVKDQFFNPDNYNKEELHETLWTMYSTGLIILQCYAPYMPYITEHIYQTIFASNEKTTSLHITQLPENNVQPNAKNKATMMQLLQLISTVRKLKTEQQLSLKTEINTLTIQCDQSTQQAIKTHQTIIQGICKTNNIIFDNAATEITQHNEVWNISVQL
jgi:valyl-tRNA synthetase